jgi:tellurite resistance protein
MPTRLFSQTRLLEQAFFSKRDAELIAEMRRREKQQTQKRALAEISGIKDEYVLEQLMAHEIHGETLAAFSLIPILEVAWADGRVQPAEREVLLRAIEEAGVPKNGISYNLMAGWLTQPPEPKLMKLWAGYTRALMQEISPEAGQRIKETVLKHARAVAEAAGGFLGLGRIAAKEAEVLKALEAAFGAAPAKPK